MILEKIFKVLLISDDFQMICQSYNQNWKFLGLIDIMTCLYEKFNSTARVYIYFNL